MILGFLYENYQQQAYIHYCIFIQQYTQYNDTRTGMNYPFSFVCITHTYMQVISFSTNLKAKSF